MVDELEVKRLEAELKEYIGDDPVRQKYQDDIQSALSLCETYKEREWMLTGMMTASMEELIKEWEEQWKR